MAAQIDSGLEKLDRRLRNLSVFEWGELTFVAFSERNCGSKKVEVAHNKRRGECHVRSR